MLCYRIVYLKPVYNQFGKKVGVDYKVGYINIGRRDFVENKIQDFLYSHHGSKVIEVNRYEPVRR